MRPKPDPPELSELLRENEDLRRQIEALQSTGPSTPRPGPSAELWKPSPTAIRALLLGAVVLIGIGFLAGYRPLARREALITAEARASERALERVKVVEVRRSQEQDTIQLPGNIEAITEAPILARGDGYLARRTADIGDRVRAGQALAGIEAPEMEEQVQQAKAALAQAKAAVDQAVANSERGQADEELARVTAARWAALLAKGAVSRQENDRYQSEYKSLAAAAKALDQALVVARSNVAAADANLARLHTLESYLLVKAPFDGVITLRNVDVGALVNAGNTLLYRIAQIQTLRTYVNLPQANASQVGPGQTARLSVSNLPGHVFAGTVTRTANALDPATRTLLVEVRVPNPDGTLLPGMYAEVELTGSRAGAPLRIPSDALIVRGEGTQVAVVRNGRTVHLQKIAVGRDYGDQIEVVSGLSEGQSVVANPGDVVREGLEVEPVQAER